MVSRSLKNRDTTENVPSCQAEKNEQKDVVGAKFINVKETPFDQDVLLQWQSYFSNLLNETKPFEDMPPVAAHWRNLLSRKSHLHWERWKKKTSGPTGLTSVIVDLLTLRSTQGSLGLCSNHLQLQRKWNCYFLQRKRRSVRMWILQRHPIAGTRL